MGSLLPWLRVGLIVLLLDPIVALDTKLQSAVQAARGEPWNTVMQAATDSGKKEIVYGFLLAVAVFSGPAGPATAREALFALIPSSLAVDVLKRIVGRTRPDGDAKRSNSSFPSSHAAGAFALATVISRRWPKGWPWFFLFAVLVAFSRMWLNRHFLSDVVVGAVIGFGWAWWVGRWTEERARRRAAPAVATAAG